MERLRAGDPEAFNDLVRAQHGRVFSLARRLLRHTEDAQVVTQEAFLAAYPGMREFCGQSTVGTWPAIAYRKAANRLRRKRADGWESVEAFEAGPLSRETQSVQYVTDRRHTTAQYYAQAAVRALLDAALGRLPAEARAVFELRDLQGLDFREGAARGRLHRARQYLLAELAGKITSTGAPR